MLNERGIFSTKQKAFGRYRFWSTCCQIC
jgi:hypothetical protein